MRTAWILMLALLLAGCSQPPTPETEEGGEPPVPMVESEQERG